MFVCMDYKIIFTDDTTMSYVATWPPEAIMLQGIQEFLNNSQKVSLHISTVH